MRAGTVQAAQGSVLTSDPFSFTMSGEPWLTQSWLVELFYGWAEGLTGLGFVPFTILIVGLLTFLGIGVIAYRNSKSPTATAIVLVLGVLVLISFFVPRPVIYSYLLMVLVMVAWDHPTTRWAVPFLFWIWASVHASFLIGLGYVGLSILMQREWREIPKAIAAGLVTLATAHGLGAVNFLLDFVQSRDALRYLTEWRRPGLDDVMFIPLLGTLVYGVIGFVRRAVPWRYLWVFIPFGVLGFTSVRAIPAAWLGLLPVLGLSLSGLELGSRAGLRRNLAAVFGIFVLALPFFLTKEASLSEETFPTAAVTRLGDKPTFHDDRVGGFLIWAEGPDRPVYIDDRAELYGDRIHEFFQVRTGQIDWKPVFDRDGIEQVLLANTEDLIPELMESGWDTAYRDEYFTVLRNDA
ncbi:MAG TPA: hypothetical protein VE569_11975 [Acidimicrobiia bacterium]|nr:hypothetical protein [Acidimicrobiia bacterium]